VSDAERTWADTDLPELMLDFSLAKWGRRKLWLYGCACLRRSLLLLMDQHAQSCVDLAERVADGVASEQEMIQALQRRTAFSALATQGEARDSKLIDHLFVPLNPPASVKLSYMVADEMGLFRVGWAWSKGNLPDEKVDEYVRTKFGERRAQCDLLRDIFGNPFRPVVFDPKWRTEDALGLSCGIYEDRAFDRLPLLADALMDAGCDDEQVLGHCRSDGPHVRGCWVVDLVLGKE
jgi:hypothetical protein